ncbi:hypothetical protein Dda_0658 [Drechslerella dactyloides]|uniref:Uncharacterized protein n=1 Tax=Drechslerella dactyloides TaxID=74499 RepID=A0AAD6J826_DREDA|nr:hypothetical protein Dda_0658 [Drechslerella dactyloides]
MPFSSGRYVITSVGSDKPVGGRADEDADFGPKDIYSDDASVAMWEIEARPDGSYVFKQDGAPVSAMGTSLCAFLHYKEEQVAKWQIRDTDDGNAYEILKADGSAGWTVIGSKVNVQSLSGGDADRFVIQSTEF